MRTGRSKERRCRLALVALLVMALTPVSAAEAAVDDVLTCYWEDAITSTPGITDQPGWYQYESDDKALLECHGSLEGESLAGPGWFTQVGSGYGTCYAASGFGHIEGMLPTESGGHIWVTGDFVLERVGLTGTATGHINGVLVTGPYAAQPSIERLGCSEENPSRNSVVRGTATAIQPADGVMPRPPQEVWVEAIDGDSARVSWSPAPPNDHFPITGYRLYRDNLRIDEVGPDSTEFIDTSLAEGTYVYDVAAFNAAGESEHAGRIYVSIGPDDPWDGQDWGAPKDLVITEAKGGLEMSWSPPWDGDIGDSAHGYAIFRNRELIDWADLATHSYLDRRAQLNCEPLIYHVALRWDTGFSYSAPITWEPTSPRCR